MENIPRPNQLVYWNDRSGQPGAYAIVEKVRGDRVIARLADTSTLIDAPTTELELVRDAEASAPPLIYGRTEIVDAETANGQIATVVYQVRLGTVVLWERRVDKDSRDYWEARQTAVGDLERQLHGHLLRAAGRR